MDYNTINNDVTRQVDGGQVLAGRFRIVGPLGHGGMGSVWLAEDTLLDGKRFAVKMLPSVLANNKRAYRQLKDEALVAMKLTHPNIVTIRAFEENEGNPFLVMDYVEGQRLDEYIAEHATGRGGLSESEVLCILKPVASALDYAHEQGVVHRDIKPGNVMIRSDGHPFILDFGIAREIQETMTRVTGKLSSGTLLYMSPEQLRGYGPKPAQDVYSFAVMAYECLKGEPPFTRGQIEFQILNEQPESLAGRDGISAPLAEGVMSALAKKPEDRPATCMEVLEGYVSRRAAKAHSSHSSVGKAIGILALLAAIAAGGWYCWQKHDEDVQASLEATRQKAEAAKAELLRIVEENARLEKDHAEAQVKCEKAEAEREAARQKAEAVEAERQRIAEEKARLEKERAEAQAKREMAEAEERKRLEQFNVQAENRARQGRESAVYVVQHGDYLAKIAKRFQVKLDALRKANPQLKNDVVTIGQKLKIPGRAAVDQQGMSEIVSFPKPSYSDYRPYSGPTKEYVVKSGDSLGAIAYWHGINIRQLKELNGLNSDVTRVGQILRVPAR